MKITKLFSTVSMAMLLALGSTAFAQCDSGCSMNLSDGAAANVYEPVMTQPMMGQPTMSQPMMMAPTMGGCDTGGCGSAAPAMAMNTTCGNAGNASGGCSSGGCASGAYFSVFGGGNFMDIQNSTGFQREVEADFNDGGVIGVSVGRRLGALRGEVEYTFRRNTPNTIDFNGNPTPQNTVDGSTNAHSCMFNLAMDFFQNSRLKPYAGAGVGFSFINSDLSYGSLPARLQDNESSFAYQLFAGVSNKLTRNAELFAEYRYFEAHNPKFNRFGGPGINGAPQNIILNSEYNAENVNFGLRFSF